MDCPLFATKPPFHPRSSRCSFSECLYTRHFPKQALLDLPRSLMSRGKSEPFSQENPALSREVEIPSAARDGCGAGTPAGHGGKVNRFRRKTRHFPRGWKWQVQRERSVEPVPLQAAGESEPFSQENPALSRRWKRQVRRERSVEPVPLPAAGESELFSRKNPALSREVETAGAARGVCRAGAHASCGGK